MTASIPRHARRALALALLLGSLVVASPPGAPARAEMSGAVLGFNAGAAAALATGSFHTCAILGPTELKCWGVGLTGQLGYGDTSDRGLVPAEMGNGLPAVSVGNYAAFNQGVLLQVVAGHTHTCVILADGEAPNVGRNGRVKCWGEGGSGRLGYGDTQNRGDGFNEMGEQLPFVNLGTGRFATQLAAGELHTCALLDNGRVKCWGSGFAGKLGYGDGATRGDDPGEMGNSLPYVDLGTGRTAVQISAGLAHTCAVLDDATLKCWGYNEYGQLGLGDRTYRGDGPGEMGDALPTVDLGTEFAAIAVSAGFYHTCARSSLGAVKCWGLGDGGVLGIGSTDTRGDGPGEMGDALPVVNLGSGELASAISAGSSHTCAFNQVGARCWGSNGFGQLGVGDVVNRGTTPSQMGANLPIVPLPGTVRAVAAGATHTCALTQVVAIELRCWGNGGGGRLGTGSTATIGDQVGEVAALNAVALGTGRAVSPRPTAPSQPSGLSSPRWVGDQWRLTLTSSLGDGGSPVTGYRVEASADGGRTWTALGTTNGPTFDVTSRAFGSRPLFRTVPLNAIGAGMPSFPQFPSISTTNPARLLDTRSGGATVDGAFQRGGRRAAGSTLELQVAGRGGAPSTVKAAVLNVTVTGATAAGFVTVYPCGSPRPNASNLNYTSGRTVPNAVVSAVGAGGKVCVYTESAAHLVADLNGWFLPGNSVVTRSPARLLDTRSSGQTVDGAFQRQGIRAAGSTLQLDIVGRAGLAPDTGTVVLNVTTSGSSAPGFITVFPCGEVRPNASNLNHVAGQTVANLVVTKVGAGGRVCLYAESATHLIADVTASFPTDGRVPVSEAPIRMLDTRPSGRTYDRAFEGAGRLPAGATVELAVQGRPDILVGYEGVVLNVTVTGATAPGFVTVFPCGAPRPNASNLNYTAGQTVPNLVVSKLGRGGTVCLYTESPAHLIVDLSTRF